MPSPARSASRTPPPKKARKVPLPPPAKKAVKTPRKSLVVPRPARPGARPVPAAAPASKPKEVNGKPGPLKDAKEANGTPPGVTVAPVAKPAASMPPAPPVKAPRVSPFAIKAPPPTNTAPLKLVVGDKAVHPKLGLGEVVAVEERVIGGSSIQFYVLRILDKSNSRAMVPTNLPSGLRAVMSDAEAEAVLDTMRAREVAIDLQPWSRRFRAYTEMINSGLPHEVAKVLRDMYRLKFDKDLSFGERRLLDQAKSLLMKELAAAKQITEEALVAQVAAMFQN